jgi:hypothetical protein
MTNGFTPEPLFKPGDKAYTSKYGVWYLWGEPCISEHVVVAASPNGRLKVDNDRGYRDIRYFKTREDAWIHYRQLVIDKIAMLRDEIGDLETFAEKCHD